MPLQPDPYAEVFNLQWWVSGGLTAEVFSRETSDGWRYICEHPDCGHEKPWALKYFPNRAMMSFYSACPRHEATRGEIPGSLILWYKDEMDTMPDVLIERELDLHLAYYLKEIQREQTQSGDTRKQVSPDPRIDTAGILAELEGGSRADDRQSA